jgi:hypothetical protein
MEKCIATAALKRNAERDHVIADELMLYAESVCVGVRDKGEPKLFFRFIV